MDMKIFDDKMDTVLVIDDEPFNTEWLSDYFEARKFKVVHAEDLQSALDALESARYRYVVVDLSIPVSPLLAQPLASLGSEFFRYPGLMAARRARSTGHNSFQVIVYSVHDSSEVDTYAELIDCRYILKGRPRELKEHVESTLHRRPSGWHSVPKSAVRPNVVKPGKAKKAVKKKKLAVRKKKSFYLRFPSLTPTKLRAISKGSKPT
jgi:CheY-like chemotaxis protein